MSGRSRETIGSNIEQRHPSCLPFFLLFTSSFIFPLTSLFTSPLLIYFSLSLLHITPTSNLTHTHTHTSGVSTVTPVKREHYVSMAGSLMPLPPRNNNVWSQRGSQSTQNFRRGTRREAHWSTACPKQREILQIVSGPL